MRRHISAAQKETTPVLHEASSLLSQKHDVEVQQQLLDAFNKHFIISDEELTILTASTEPVDDRFFEALARVKVVYKDCQVLLGSSNQTLGLEVMDQTSRNLNSAYQKLYHWVQREFKTLHLENPQISTPIRQALRVLAERPSLFQSCLDSFSEVREDTLLDAFHTALIGPSSSIEQQSSTKPIELVAHDPLRYVGDMLAWTHSVTVSEREALEVLFISEGDGIAKGIQAGKANEPWSLADGEESAVFDGRKALEQLVNRDVSGVARGLRQRIEQVIQSNEDSILEYKIANLIKFYRVTFSKLIGADSVLLDTLADLEEHALNQFRLTQRDHIASLQTHATHPPTDLTVPYFLTAALNLLTALLKTHDTSLIPTSSLHGDSDEDASFQPILAEALDPYLRQCTALARTLTDPDATIFLLNCLLATRQTLLPFPFTRERVAELDTTIDEHASTLVEHQHAFFLRTSGLQPLITALAPFLPPNTKAASNAEDTDSNPEEPDPPSLCGPDLATIASLPALQPHALAETSRILDDFLPSALLDAMENLKRVGSARVVRDVTEEAAGRFCEDFEGVVWVIAGVDQWRDGEKEGGEGEEGEEEEEAEDEGEGERPRLRDLFPRTSAEIRVLLS